MSEFDLQKFSQNLLNKCKKYMYLKIFVDSDDVKLINKYSEAIKEHNLKIMSSEHIDAGFDLFCPDTKRFASGHVNKLDYKITCSAQIVESQHRYCTGFYMYPRSSISKSNIRLANNVGIIDAGYRGHLIGMFDLIYKDEITIEKFDRYLQICAPGLIPIIVEMVSSIEELGEKTLRGDGGFGSTGL